MVRKANIKKQNIATSSLKGNDPDETSRVNWEALIPILGQVRDVLIAECYGVSRERVRQIRKKFKIPLKSKQKSQVQIPVSELKEFSLIQLAAKYGVHTYDVSIQRALHGISNKRGTVSSKLGRLLEKGVHLRVTDQKIAQMLGCSVSQVQKKRMELGYYKREYRTNGSRRSK